MEVFDAGRKFRASFRQIGEVLLSRQKAFIPPNLAFGFSDLGIGFAQPLVQSLNLTQEWLPTGLHCLSSSSRCCAVRFSASRVSRRDDTSRSRASTSVGSSTPASTSSFRLLAWPSRPSVVLATSSLCLWLQPQSVLADPAEQLSDEQFLPLAPFKREEVPSTRLAGKDAAEEEIGGTGTFANELLIRFLFAVGKRFTLPVEEIALHLADLGSILRSDR